MTIITIHPLQNPIVEEIDGGLESMQQKVGGYIELLMPWEDEVAIVCNEEGKLLDLPANRLIFDDVGNPIDVIAGTFFLCSAPADAENLQSIPADLIPKYLNKFSYWR